MELGLRDKVVAVTGGASGIGLAAVHAFVHEGARVTVLDRDPAALERLAKELDGIEIQQLDVAVAEEVDAAFDTIVEREGRIDIGVNNAGIARGLSWLHDMDERDYDAVLSVNLRASGCACAPSSVTCTPGAQASSSTRPPPPAWWVCPGWLTTRPRSGA